MASPANDNAKQGFFTASVMMKLGVAAMFDFLKFIFALFFLFAPLAIGAVAGLYVTDKCSASFGEGSLCNSAGALVGSATAITGYAAEFFTGAGVAAIEAVGEFFADFIDLMACLVFMIWAIVQGRKFFGGKRPTNQFFIITTSTIAGAIPFVNVLPTTMAGVAAMEWQNYLHTKETAAKETKQVAAQLRAQQIEDQQEARNRAIFAQMQAQAANDNAPDEEARSGAA
jgi:hypothetical protein